MAAKTIQLRGVEVHNLKQVDLDLPHRQLICFCGVSGSGKTSLALDTLYAEGQRRYIESFSAYTRQFLERLEKPAAERIEGIPAAIAVTRKNASRSNRSTVGTVTETAEYLRLLFARAGQVICRNCHTIVRRDTPTAATNAVLTQIANDSSNQQRLMITFQVVASTPEEVAQLREEGFVRVIAGERMINLATESLPSVETGHNTCESSSIDLRRRRSIPSGCETRWRWRFDADKDVAPF